MDYGLWIMNPDIPIFWDVFPDHSGTETDRGKEPKSTPYVKVRRLILFSIRLFVIFSGYLWNVPSIFPSLVAFTIVKKNDDQIWSWKNGNLTILTRTSFKFIFRASSTIVLTKFRQALFFKLSFNLFTFH